MTPPALAAWLALSGAAAPAARLLLRRRLRRGKEDPARVAERRGVASAPRPPGFLVWAHAASVGEAAAAAPLVEALGAARPDWRFLLTTGTRASAEAAARRPLPRMVHQYAPLDLRPWARRFLDHWRPDLALRVDSELWPATLWETARRGAPLALVNARMSARSARAWGRAPASARALLGLFARILPQDAESAARFLALGAPPERLGVPGALKAAAPPPAADPATLDALRRDIGPRPCWLAASTHAEDEALVLDAHATLLRARPEALLILAPRHAERGAALMEQAAARGFRIGRRAAGEGPEGVAVYVADTMGELGLWYRLAPFAFIGGSGGAGRGGHNPYEAAALGAVVAHGSDTVNFAEPYRALAQADAAFVVSDAPALAEAAAACLAPGGGPTEAARRRAEAARRALAPDRAALDRAVAALLDLAPGEGRP